MRNSPPDSRVSSFAGVAAEGGADALGQAMRALRPDLLRFAQWLARDRALAEDIVQEALLRAWRSRQALQDPAALRPWLLTIVRREHARLYERKRLELVSLDEEIVNDGGGSQAAPGELDELQRAIQRLPLEYREPLIMQVLGGHSTAEIAAELALTNSAVLTRLFRARNRLRAIYGLVPAPDVTEGAGP